MKLVFTCEHASHRVPRPHAGLFAGKKKQLLSHRGWDPGAQWLAQRLAKAFGAPLYSAGVTRLLIDTNRSLRHPNLFSHFSAALSEAERQDLVDRYYHPHRAPIEADLRRIVGRGTPVLHIGVHSFTPIWQNEPRPCDIGLLYDPRRPTELGLCRHWQGLLARRAPLLRVRRNYPYRGAADGFTTHLRRALPGRLYAGVEIELNQRLVARPSAARTRMAQQVESTLRALISGSRKAPA